MLKTALEFYSGIGGWHFALNDLNHLYGISIIGAIEINDVANAVYKHNFPTTPLLQCNILSLSVEQLDDFNADVWFLSPPCQPFTRVGKKRDVADERSESFLHLLNQLMQMKRPPALIFIENVKGFEVSRMRDILLDSLRSYYSVKECLLDSTPFVPNSRCRYYAVAASKSLLLTTDDLQWPPNKATFVGPPLIGDYLDTSLPCEYDPFEQFRVPDKILAKHASILDIVTAASDHSCCFTKAYTHYVEGTGSVLQSNTDVCLSDVYAQASALVLPEDQARKLELLRKLKLRYFSPREVANLLGFPDGFSFPHSISNKVKYLRVLRRFVLESCYAVLLTRITATAASFLGKVQAIG